MGILAVIALVIGIIFFILGVIFVLNGTGLINGGIHDLQTNATSNPGQGFISYLTGTGAGFVSDIIGAVLIAVGIVLVLIGLKSQ